MTPSDWADGSADAWAKTLYKSPQKVAAGKKRRPWSDEDRQRLREQCQQRQPWLHSTGPRSYLGKRKAAANGKRRRPDPDSIRQLRAGLADIGGMIGGMADLRRATVGI